MTKLSKLTQVKREHKEDGWLYVASLSDTFVWANPFEVSKKYCEMVNKCFFVYSLYACSTFFCFTLWNDNTVYCHIFGLWVPWLSLHWFAYSKKTTSTARGYALAMFPSILSTCCCFARLLHLMRQQQYPWQMAWVAWVHAAVATALNSQRHV